MKEPKTICKWCLRFDCVVKGGSRKVCPVDDNIEPDGITHAATIKHQKEIILSAGGKYADAVLHGQLTHAMLQGTVTGRFKSDKPNISAEPRGKAQHATILDDDNWVTVKQKKKRKKDESAAVVDSYCFLKNNGLL